MRARDHRPQQACGDSCGRIGQNADIAGAQQENEAEGAAEVAERVAERYRPWLRTLGGVLRRATGVSSSADFALAESMGALFWTFAGALVLLLLPFSPPDEAAGAVGWVIAGAGVGFCFLVGFRRADPDQDVGLGEIYLFVFVGLFLIAILEWLAGGRETPYHYLYTLPLLFAAGVFQPSRVLVAVGAISALLWLPALYDGADLTLAVDIATEMFMFIFIAAGVWALFVTLRVQREGLVKSREKARKLARRDPLTRLGNRRLMTEAVEREVARARRREQTELSVLVGDLDHFKAVNDHAGHEVGDRFLRDVAKRIREVKRDADEAFRWGGDEFAVLMPGADAEAAEALGMRINEAIAALEVPEGVGSLSFTFGYASFDDDDDDPQNFLLVADKILIRNKQGRTRRP